MANNGKTTERKPVQKDVQRDRVSSQNLTVDQLKATEASVIENIGALRFSITRIEDLERIVKEQNELLLDCRVPLDAHGHKVLTRRIDKIIKDS